MNQRRINKITELITGRKKSAFEEDLQKNKRSIKDKIRNQKILVIGAGTIGSSLIKELVKLGSFGTLDIVDINENALANLMRELNVIDDTLWINTYCVDAFDYLKERNNTYKYVFNMAALKHVRSERNYLTLDRMFKTNIKLVEAIWNSKVIWGGDERTTLFSVSSDKAVRPANLMGVSKRLMEKNMSRSSKTINIAARFPNVAFSNGSLLESFVHRFEKRYPLFVPRDIERYFYSYEEAGQACLLSAMIGYSGITIPGFEMKKISMIDAAKVFIEESGYEAIEYESKHQAMENITRDLERQNYPYVVTEPTAGEKQLEEFICDGEELEDIGNINMKYTSIADVVPAFDNMLDLLFVLDMGKIKEFCKMIVPDFQYVKNEKNLDEVA